MIEQGRPPTDPEWAAMPVEKVAAVQTRGPSGNPWPSEGYSVPESDVVWGKAQ